MQELELKVLDNLVRYRKQAGLSQKQVEASLELRANTLYDIEKGRLKLPFVMAAQLSELYHIQIGQLLGDEEQTDTAKQEDKIVQNASPLESLGVVSGAFHPLAEYIAQDPVIVAEVGVGELGKKPIMTLLLAKLTPVQKQHFVLDLYRYINSVISSDGEIRDSELKLRDILVAQAQIELTDSEKQSIARAFRKPFFGKSMAKSLPREGYKHFLIWTLHLVSRIDGKVYFGTSDYITQVAEHIQLPVSSLRFIEAQVALAYQDTI
ncbi:helix-turn-helix domain-containing protein [Reinekea sp.]|jgi:transcriptional regulator with XRE-family HTH domain|uniref:helix-turn-helix domain-containing protein n=1 Tax=Reinekea sp. TaxID=1970455 RepID=UPI00398A2D7C